MTRHTQLMQFKEKWGAKRLPFSIYQKNLSRLQPQLWQLAWRCANSKIGSLFVDLLRRDR